MEDADREAQVPVLRWAATSATAASASAATAASASASSASSAAAATASAATAATAAAATTAATTASAAPPPVAYTGPEPAAATLRPMTTTTLTPPVRNGVDTAQVFGTLDAIKAQPELARFQFRATNRWIDGAHNRSTIKGFYGAGQEDASREPRRSSSTPASRAVLLGTDTGAQPGRVPAARAGRRA